ncbi:MAG: hypothetical protein ACRCUJ_04685 [Phocaeicola sp.]
MEHQVKELRLPNNSSHKVPSSQKTLVLFSSMVFSIAQLSKAYPEFFFDSHYKPISFVEKCIRKVSLIFNICKHYWLGEWRKKIKEFDTIILFATADQYMLDYLHKHKTKKQRIIYWYWNPIRKCVNPDYVKKLGFETWSFDLNESKMYNLNQNTTFYINNLEKNVQPVIKYDVCFLGLNKNRFQLLEQITGIINTLGLTSFLYIVDESAPIKERKTIMKYDDYLKYVLQSKVLLDIQQEGQEGLTVRVMESIFFEKKLITTNKKITEEKFYNQMNIFIFGIDDVTKLKNFINTPYQEIDKSIVDHYEFSHWINRFDI